jgi:hypothetical protein
MLDRWQIVLVAAVLTVAWFVDVQLFALLAATSVAGVVFVQVQGRARARRHATGALDARLRAYLGVAADAPLETRRGRRRLELTVADRPGRDGLPHGCLLVRAPVAGRIPFCFVAQQTDGPLRPTPLVENAAVFATPIECELHPVEAPPALPDHRWVSSSPGGLRHLFDAELAAAAAVLGATPGASVAALLFDGAAVHTCVVPEEPTSSEWIAPALEATAAFAEAMEGGLFRLADS